MGARPPGRGPRPQGSVLTPRSATVRRRWGVDTLRLAARHGKSTLGRTARYQADHWCCCAHGSGSLRRKCPTSECSAICEPRPAQHCVHGSVRCRCETGSTLWVARVRSGRVGSVQTPGVTGRTHPHPAEVREAAANRNQQTEARAGRNQQWLKYAAPARPVKDGQTPPSLSPGKPRGRRLQSPRLTETRTQ